MRGPGVSGGQRLPRVPEVGHDLRHRAAGRPRARRPPAAGDLHENVDFTTLAAGVGDELARRLSDLTLELYRRGGERAAASGLILADTKFELGLDGGELLLIDEVLTPDSSRYWDAAAWTPGVEPASFDKQYVRNWLDDVGWDHESPPPELPAEVVEGTLARYVEAFRRITGREPEL